MYRGGVGDEGDDLDFFLAGGTEINLKFEHGCDFSLRSGQHVPEAEKSQTCQRDEAKLRSLVNVLANKQSSSADICAAWMLVRRRAVPCPSTAVRLCRGPWRAVLARRDNAPGYLFAQPLQGGAVVGLYCPGSAEMFVQ